MRHILPGVLLATLIGLSGTGPAMAQNPFEPVIYINNKAVTRYEVDQRIRFMQILGQSGVTASAAQDELVQDRLRIFAAEQIGISVSDKGLQTGLDEFAGRAGMDAAQFTAALERAGVEPQVYRDFVRAGVAWRGVIRQRLLPLIDVSDAEVDQALKQVIETPIVTRVLLSELIIPAPPGQERQAMALATRIAASNPDDAAFSAAARQYSAAGTAQAGGRLEWTALDNLPPSLRPIITSLQPGQTSQPLTVQNAVVLFRLRDTQGTLRPGAREQVLDYMSLAVADRGEAARLLARTRGCDDLYVQAGARISPQIQRQTASQGAIPTVVATQLASLDPGEGSLTTDGVNTLLVMLCSRQSALAAQAQADVPVTAQPDDGVEAGVPQSGGLPSRDAVREELFNRKANAAASAYLAELRADAVIRRP